MLSGKSSCTQPGISSQNIVYIIEAYLTIFRIVKPAAESGVKYLFKKTDSALRGNIGAELTAMLDATGKSLLSFVQAFPQINRVTVNGVHYIEGIPVDRSVFGSDPFEPVTEANVEKLEQSSAVIFLLHPA